MQQNWTDYPVDIAQMPIVAKYLRPRRLSIVRDVVAIVRDVLIILVIVSTVLAAGKLLSAVQGDQAAPAPVPSCIMLDPNDNDRCLVDGG